MDSASHQVVGAVIRKADKILCVQRGPSKTLAGYWEFPGGKIESGETPKQALRREIREELLCDIKVGPRICSTKQHYDFGTIELTTFLCSLNQGKPTLTEHTQLCWIPQNELSSLDWAPADQKTVHHLTATDRINEQLNHE